jgi:hypothetical protein
MMEAGKARAGAGARRPGLAVVLPLVLAAAAVGSHFLGEWLARRDQQLHRTTVVRGRATSLDLVRELPPRARTRVLAALARELRRASPAGKAHARGVAACKRPRSGACARAARGLDAWLQEARAAERWSLGWQVGLMAALALVTVAGGWVTVRHARGRLAGLALLGAALVIVGAGWRVSELFREQQARRVSYARDVGVGRARLALELPAARRTAVLRSITGQLERDGAPEHLVGGLRAAGRRCGLERGRCGRVLILLGRIHAANRELPPASRIRRWLNRWLLWSGAVFLLLVALVSAARLGRADDAGEQA